MALIRSFGSKQTQSLPFFGGTTTTELIHGVGVVTCSITSCSTRSSSVSLSLGLNATATRRGTCWMGWALGCMRILYSPDSWPTPSLKTDGNLASISSCVSTDCGQGSAMNTAAFPVCGLFSESLSLYWIMSISKHALRPRIGRISLLPTDDNLTSRTRLPSRLW